MSKSIIYNYFKSLYGSKSPSYSNQLRRFEDVPSPSPMPFKPLGYPNKFNLFLPLSLLPLVYLTYNVLMPPLIMGILSYVSTILLIPVSSKHLVRAGLRGRDLLKPHKQLMNSVFIWFCFFTHVDF